MAWSGVRGEAAGARRVVVVDLALRRRRAEYGDARQGGTPDEARSLGAAQGAEAGDRRRHAAEGSSRVTAPALQAFPSADGRAADSDRPRAGAADDAGAVDGRRKGHPAAIE